MLILLPDVLKTPVFMLGFPSTLPQLTLSALVAVSAVAALAAFSCLPRKTSAKSFPSTVI